MCKCMYFFCSSQRALFFTYRYGFYLLPSRISFKFFSFFFPNALRSHTKNHISWFSAHVIMSIKTTECISWAWVTVCVCSVSCYSPHQDHQGYVYANRQLKIKVKKKLSNNNNNHRNNKRHRKKKRESQKETYTWIPNKAAFEYASTLHLKLFVCRHICTVHTHTHLDPSSSCVMNVPFWTRIRASYVCILYAGVYGL